MNRSTAGIAIIAAVAVLAAGCETRDDPDPFDSPTTEALETPPQDQPAMDDLQMRLVNHMNEVRGSDAREFRQQFPEHRELVNEMLEDCRQMMREMDMTPPRRFTQVETALENDLERIPDMSDAELDALIPEHLDRVQTVIDMRQDMMDDMM